MDPSPGQEFRAGGAGHHMRPAGGIGILSALLVFAFTASGFVTCEDSLAVFQIPPSHVDSGLFARSWSPFSDGIDSVLFGAENAKMGGVYAAPIFADVVYMEQMVSLGKRDSPEGMQGNAMCVSAAEPFTASGISGSVPRSNPRPTSGFDIWSDSRPDVVFCTGRNTRFTRTEPVAEHGTASPPLVGGNGLSAVLAGSVLLNFLSHEKGV